MAPTGDSSKTNQPSTGGTTKGNTAVPAKGPHDRVQMLSLRADGTPDQTPGVELIGDPAFAKAAAREQFAQQAVSAADQLNAPTGDTMVVGNDGETAPAADAPQDPSIQERKDEHDKLQEEAHKAADKMVDALSPEADQAGSKAKS